MDVSIPKQITAISISLMVLIKTLLRLILFAHISEKDMKPRRHVNAKSPKQSDTSSVTTLLNPVPGVSSSTDARYFGSFPSSIHAAPFSVSHARPMITTNPVRVQITMVSRKTPIA